jgi:hypothetical protein
MMRSLFRGPGGGDGMRLKPVPEILIIVLIVATLTLVACGHSLKGTTWRGDGLLTGNVALTFTTDTECQLGIGKVGATGTYSVADDQVTVNVMNKTYVFTESNDSMTGHIYGMSLTLNKQE